MDIMKSVVQIQIIGLIKEVMTTNETKQSENLMGNLFGNARRVNLHRLKYQNSESFIR